MDVTVGVLGENSREERIHSRQTKPKEHWSSVESATLVHADTDAVDCTVRRASKNCEDNASKYVRKKRFCFS